MYLSQTGNPLDLLVLAVLVGMIGIGGWITVGGLFRLRDSEGMMVGVTAGLLAFISLSNLAIQWLGSPAGYWLAAVLILASGVSMGIARGSFMGLLRVDARALLQLMLLGTLTGFFLLIFRGLAIFDDYHNLPLISTLAAGDIPPHYYLNPGFRLAYHYGPQLIAAALVRVGGLFPWSAFDFTNALTISMSLILGWLWVERLTSSRLAASLFSLMLALVGGTRWLLLLLPPSWLDRIDQQIQMLGTAVATGPNLLTNLQSPWVIEGGGPLPFPFVHVNGIMLPLILAITGRAAFHVLIPLVLLLLTPRDLNFRQAGLLGLLLSALALSDEVGFVLLMAGIPAAYLLTMIAGKTSPDRPTPPALPWAMAFVMAAGLASMQGGTISEVLRGFLAEAAGGTLVPATGVKGFQFVWPPALVSAHFGVLPLNNVFTALLGLFEVGPVLLLAPFTGIWTWRRIRSGEVLPAGAGLASFGATLVPLFLHYQVTRDTTRITESGLWYWMVLGFPLLWQVIAQGSIGAETQSIPPIPSEGIAQAPHRSSRVSIPSGWPAILFALGYCMAVMSGINLFSTELVALKRPVQSYFVEGVDAQMARAYWNQLEEEARVLDILPYRAVTLFGRPGLAHDGYQQVDPAWEELVEDPPPKRAEISGYTHVYIDELWWWRIPEGTREAYSDSCPQLVDEVIYRMATFRRLYDLRPCR